MDKRMGKERSSKVEQPKKLVTAEMVLLSNRMPRPSPQFEVLYRDGDETNLDISNLTWVEYKAEPDKVVHRFPEPRSIYDYF